MDKKEDSLYENTQPQYFRRIYCDQGECYKLHIEMPYKVAEILKLDPYATEFNASNRGWSKFIKLEEFTLEKKEESCKLKQMIVDL